MKVGQWYRWRLDGKDSWRQAYEIVGVGRDFVIYRTSMKYAAHYMTKADFEAGYELIAEGSE